MLFRAPLLAVAAALLAHQVSANGGTVTCAPGTYIDGALNCIDCPDGHVNPNWVTSNKKTSCTPCDVGKGCNSARTECTTCAPGEYSTGRNGCQKCPAGQTNTPDHKGCQKCEPGTFNPTRGSTCDPCDKGSFNNIAGAKSCCRCCAGWYADNEGSTSCTQCPASDKFSVVGADNAGDCTYNQGRGASKLPDPTLSCSMVADNVCPNPKGNGPQGTAISIKRRGVQCTKGFESCPRFSGEGGFDCVDTENDPESCGGCRTLDGEGSGTDCTAIKGVSVTRCVKRSCVIDSCRKGWVKSLDGASCVPAGSDDGLHVQDTDAKKKRSSAKRAIRHTIF